MNDHNSTYDDDQHGEVGKLIITKLPTYNTYPLKHTWTVYDHLNSDKDYGHNMRTLGNLSTVVDFWRFFNYYPKPSALFHNGACKPLIGSNEITAVSFFKGGIMPQWEDPMNKDGANFSKRKFHMHAPLRELDENWEDLLMECIGEQIDSTVTGIRIVDSTSINIHKPTEYKLMYRIELWFSDKTQKDSIESYFKRILSLDPRFAVTYKEHHAE